MITELQNQITKKCCARDSKRKNKQDTSPFLDMYVVVVVVRVNAIILFNCIDVYVFVYLSLCAREYMCCVSLFGTRLLAHLLLCMYI